MQESVAMMLRDVARSLAGGAVVYVAVAACSASSSGPSQTAGLQDGVGGANADANTDGSGGAPGGNAGAPGGAAGHEQDGSILDALTDPVPDALADGPNTSGTRLKAKWRVGDDGSREFAGWHDSQLDLDCYFGVAADGVDRCLPYSAGLLPTYYSDAACTKLLGMAGKPPQGCPTPAIAKHIARSADSCGGAALRIYQVGAQVTPQSVYMLSGSNCVAFAIDPSTYLWYPILAEVPASSFVGSKIEIDP
jgi:hypothetical protein